ncbi:uncharacterized protein MYCFIDRAFT_87051 [Pseudocercospora fijiensis CIRAD86]|uniref:Sulfotransferase domain-containing protein n=1 Tax=Pseudocercospora fijiensis (strain CIRAD86) TaxID=383855 RepID=M2YT49_PSEFD|nr:uncharacterized protein MYCFIDRAFT_87051 [Pseudocercospora fijiensis CIRAD86]EME80915.1 hypothetical protein MYCFIDRAFT_87051 [Pseudocercospora fijiensis CIRAD86]
MPHFPSSARQHPRRFMLVTNPRTCSNLLVRILGLDNQPHTKHGSYHLLGCTIAMSTNNLWEKNADEWTEEQRQFTHGVYKKGIEDLEGNLTPGPEDKICFTKEHVETFIEPTTLSKYIHGHHKAEPLTFDIPGYSSDKSAGNETVFPDAYLESWNPIFLVRHPARAFESVYRSFIDVAKTPVSAGSSQKSIDGFIELTMTLSWTRKLYEFYGSRGMDPIIIDADDVVVNAEPLTHKLAEYIGFDTNALQYKWNECSKDQKEKQEAHFQRMLSSLNESNGVKVDPAKLSSSIKSAAELVPKWTEEFGEATAKKLERWVEAAMPDYNYLRERRMRP